MGDPISITAGWGLLWPHPEAEPLGPFGPRGDYWRVRVQRTRLLKPAECRYDAAFCWRPLRVFGPAATREVLAIWARTDAWRAAYSSPIIEGMIATLCGKS